MKFLFTHYLQQQAHAVFMNNMLEYSRVQAKYTITAVMWGKK